MQSMSLCSDKNVTVLENGVRSVRVLVEFWAQNDPDTFGSNIDETEVMSSLGPIDLFRHKYFALLVWGRRSDFQEYVQEQWIERDLYNVHDQVCLVPLTSFEEFPYQDPRWFPPFPSFLRRHEAENFSFDIDSDSAVEQFSEQADVQMTYLKEELDYRGLWKTMSRLFTNTLSYKEPFPFIFVNDKKKRASVGRGVDTFTASPHNDSHLIQHAFCTPPQCLKMRFSPEDPNVDKNFYRSILAHEFGHMLTPHCPDNEMFAEGLAELIQMVTNKVMQEPWLFTCDLDNFYFYEGGYNAGLNLGDSMNSYLSLPFKKIHSYASAQALWEVLQRNINQLRILIQITQSPLYSSPSTEEFVEIVDRQIPGFAERIASHPAFRKATECFHAAGVAGKYGTWIYNTHFTPNPNAGISRHSSPANDFGYVINREQNQSFDKNTGYAQSCPMQFTATVDEKLQIESPVEKEGAYFISKIQMKNWTDDPSLQETIKNASHITVSVTFEKDGVWQDPKGILDITYPNRAP